MDDVIHLPDDVTGLLDSLSDFNAVIGLPFEAVSNWLVIVACSAILQECTIYSASIKC